MFNALPKYTWRKGRKAACHIFRFVFNVGFFFNVDCKGNRVTRSGQKSYTILWVRLRPLSGRNMLVSRVGTHYKRKILQLKENVQHKHNQYG